MKKKQDEDRITKAMNTCLHFNGIQNEECKAGINYDSLLKGQTGALPCFYIESVTGSPSPRAHCEKLEYRTRAQAEEKVSIQKEIVSQMFLDIAEGRCPHCKERVTHIQVGSCVYGQPCGHRLYQGKAIDQFKAKE